MPRRNKSFDEYIAGKMTDLNFAREVFLASIEEFDDSVEEALKYTIQKMGLKEFSVKSEIPIQNISQFIAGERKLKPVTLDKYLRVFDLKSKITVTSVSRVRDYFSEHVSSDFE